MEKIFNNFQIIMFKKKQITKINFMTTISSNRDKNKNKIIINNQLNYLKFNLQIIQII